jgi:hypothetical protein
MEKKYICMSTIQKDFGLTKKEIDTLERKEVRNPVFGSAAKMKLFNRTDVIKKFCKKHKIKTKEMDEKLKEIKEKKEMRKKDKIDLKAKRCENEQNTRKEDFFDKIMSATIDPHIIDIYNDPIIDMYVKDGYVRGGNTTKKVIGILERKSELISKLNQKNLIYREDSKLCQEYIYGNTKQYLDPDESDPDVSDSNGSDSLGADSIVEIMLEMEWMFKNTNYKNIMTKIMDKNHEDRRSEIYYDFMDVNECSAKAKQVAIESWIDKKNDFSGCPSLVLHKIKVILEKKLADEIKQKLKKMSYEEVFKDCKENKYISRSTYRSIAKRKILEHWKEYKVESLVKKQVEDELEYKTICENIKKLFDDDFGLQMSDSEIKQIYNQQCKRISKKIVHIKKDQNKLHYNNCVGNGCRNIYSHACTNKKCLHCCEDEDCHYHK